MCPTFPYLKYVAIRSDSVPNALPSEVYYDFLTLALLELEMIDIDTNTRHTTLDYTYNAAQSTVKDSFYQVSAVPRTAMHQQSALTLTDSPSSNILHLS